VTLAVVEDGPASRAQVGATVAVHALAMPVLVDQDTTLAARMGTRASIPAFVILDRRGRVVRVLEGFLPGDDDTVERIVRTAMAER
jgi:hypothetical protein